jgi:hypothetical protein
MANAVSEAASEAASDFSEDEHLDTSWFDNFKAEEDSYNDFYPAPLTAVALFLLYVKNKELIAVDTQTCFLDERSCLTRDHLLPLVKECQIRELVHYKLTDILRYNIDLQPEEIQNFVKDPVSDNTKGHVSGRFLTSEKYLEDIHYQASIGMFQDLNALYFIYTTEAALPTTQTKRITWRPKKQKTMRIKKNLKIKKENT